MDRVIKCDLSVSSIQSTIKELQDYRDTLQDKLNNLVDALVKEGIAVAKVQLVSGQGDSKDAIVDAFYIESSGAISKAIIALDGKDALFIEFGSGIRYNNGNAHPYSKQFGYGVGTYPSEHPPNRAINPGYWWYGKKGEALHLSFGTEATMPIYHAAEAMRNLKIQKAIEIFKG